MAQVSVKTRPFLWSEYLASMSPLMHCNSVSRRPTTLKATVVANARIGDRHRRDNARIRVIDASAPSDRCRLGRRCWSLSLL